MTSKMSRKSDQFSRSASCDASEIARSQPSLLWTVLGRAALVFLGLFVSLSAALVAMGIDPLIYNSAMLKCLFVYVGLAVLLALATNRANVMDDWSNAWLALARGRSARRSRSEAVVQNSRRSETKETHHP